MHTFFYCHPCRYRCIYFLFYQIEDLNISQCLVCLFINKKGLSFCHTLNVVCFLAVHKLVTLSVAFPWANCHMQYFIGQGIFSDLWNFDLHFQMTLTLNMTLNFECRSNLSECCNLIVLILMTSVFKKILSSFLIVSAHDTACFCCVNINMCVPCGGVHYHGCRSMYIVCIQ